MVFPWFSYGFPMVSHGFPIKTSIFRWLFHQRAADFALGEGPGDLGPQVPRSKKPLRTGTRRADAETETGKNWKTIGKP